MKRKVNLVTNPNSETRKTKIRNTTCAKKRIQKDFIAKMKQEHNKVVTKKKPKIGVEHIKGNWRSYINLYPMGT